MTPSPISPEDLQVHFDTRIAGLERWIDARFVGSDKVWEEKLRDIRERVHDGNFIREEMRRNAVDYITRAELTVLLSEAFHKTVALVSLVVAIGVTVIGFLQSRIPTPP